MTDLNALVILAKVVEANSFSAAARRLKMPLSTVSRRVAELEAELGVRLLERSTRGLRATDVGLEVLDHARRGAEIAEAVANIVSDHQTSVTGTLRLSTPPSLSDTLVAPLVGAFQADHPAVRVQVFVTERFVDHIAEGVDLALRIGKLKDSTLVARRLLTYRHQLVASPSYLAVHGEPEEPEQLLAHRLLAFSRWQPENTWVFAATDGTDRRTLKFRPALAMNDYAGLAAALAAGAGIGDLPPLVQPDLLRVGRLVEVMPRWRFRPVDLSLVHPGNRFVPRPVRAFQDHAALLTPTLFPTPPT